MLHNRPIQWPQISMAPQQNGCFPGVRYELAPGKNRKSEVSPLLIEISVHFVLTGIFWLKKIP
jgi:hypothetical protein